MRRTKFPQLILATAFVTAACSEGTTTPAPTPDRLAPSFSASGDPGNGKYMVLFSGSSVPAGFAERVASLGGRVSSTNDVIGMAAVEGLSGAAAAELATSTDVNQIGPDIEVGLDPLEGIPSVEELAADVSPASPTAPQTAGFFPRQWHLRQIRAHDAWAAGRLGSPAVRVFILDTGIDYTHPDLAGKVDLAASRSFVPGDAALIAANFPAGTHPVADLHFHGTHVGATVSSNAIAAAGVTSRVTLVGVKVLGQNGFSVGSSVIDGITYAADADADVINMSLGGSFSKAGNGVFVAAIHRATNHAYAKGTLIVVSAGNANADLDHDGNSFKSYCNSSNVVCVSATGPTSRTSVNGPWQNIDSKASYSNFGVSAVDVAAPGGNGASSVTAACSKFALTPGLTICQTGTFVVGSNGTSMAAPHVTGLAALLVEQVGKDNPAQLRAAIRKSADDLGKPGRDPIYGSGRINVFNAIQ